MEVSVIFFNITDSFFHRTSVIVPLSGTFLCFLIISSVQTSFFLHSFLSGSQPVSLHQSGLVDTIDQSNFFHRWLIERAVEVMNQWIMFDQNRRVAFSVFVLLFLTNFCFFFFLCARSYKSLIHLHTAIRCDGRSAKTCFTFEGINGIRQAGRWMFQSSNLLLLRIQFLPPSYVP